MPVSTRQLLESDQPSWRRLWDGYVSFYQTDVSPEVTTATWERLIADDGPFHGVVAVNEAGEVIGLVHYLFHDVTWSIGPRCYLEDLFVDKSARRLGAGQALISAVYVAADEAGADQVYWLTQQSNVSARRLYDRVGRLTDFVKYQR